MVSPGYRSEMRVLLTGAVLVSVIAAGGAWAATIAGTHGADLLVGRAGPDVVSAGRGNDRITVEHDGARDFVRCGPGRDIVTADARDRVARDCEIVSRAVSRDRTTSPDSQHETQVEPDSFSFGSTVVATFQVGRRFDGGAADIGWATSSDGGRTWRNGVLPGQTVFSAPAGTAAFASDPVVAYDAAHAVWLISTLAITPRLGELYISRSTDGLRWSAPVVAARAATEELAYDKNWIACDNGPASPFHGRCYLAYTDHIGRRPKLAVQTSDDGGVTWSAPVIAAGGPEVVGVIPVLRPNGELVVPFFGRAQMAVVLSRDGGATFTPQATIAEISARPIARLRAFPLPTAEVDSAGRVHVAWQDCRFRPGCSANDIVLSTSIDGVSWTPPVRVASAGSRTAFIPALGADPASSRLALAFHSCASPCRIDLHLVTSPDGRRWGSPQRLSARSMPLEWIAATRSGRMLADYISISFVGGRTVTVYSLASQPRDGRLKQAIFATQPLP